MNKFVGLFVVLVCLFPFVFSSSLFGFLDNDREIYWPADINGEDINVGVLYADTAWITRLFTDDINVTNFDVNGDANFSGSVFVVGDINVGGSIEADGCVVSDCFSSASDRRNWLDLSGAIWELVRASLNVDGDVTSDSDIFAGNSLGCTGDLDVGDDAIVRGDLNVVGSSGLLGDLFVGGVATFGDGVVMEGDSNFVNIGVLEGSYLNRVVATGDSNFVNVGISGKEFFGDSGYIWDDGTNWVFQGNENPDLNFVGIGGVSFGTGKAIGRESMAFGHSSGRLEASGVGSVAMGASSLYASEEDSSKILSKGVGSFAIGNADFLGEIISSGNGSFAFGNSEGSNSVISSSGRGSFAFGNSYDTAGIINASGDGSFAGGYSYDCMGGKSFIDSYGEASFAFGRVDGFAAINSYGAGSVAMGFSDSNLTASGKGSVALGYNVVALEEASITLGKDLTNYNANSLLVQDLNVLGDANIANLTISGITFSNGGINAIGDSNFTSIGVSENSYNDGITHSEKFKSNDANSVHGLYSTALGSGTTAWGIGSFASGDTLDGYILASGRGATAMGYAHGRRGGYGYITASGNGSVAMGEAYGNESDETILASGNGAVAIGAGARAISTGTFAVGNALAGGTGAVAMGEGNTATGVGAFVAGQSNTAIGNGSTALGSVNTASGYNSTAMGFGTTASGIASTSMGYQTTAFGAYSTTMGVFSVTNGSSSMAAGVCAKTESTGAVALGGGTTHWGSCVTWVTASGAGSVALGYSDINTAAVGKGSFAAGYNVIALEEASITLGKDLTNYNANSLLVQDLNALGNVSFINPIVKYHRVQTLDTTGTDWNAILWDLNIPEESTGDFYLIDNNQGINVSREGVYYVNGCIHSKYNGVSSADVKLAVRIMYNGVEARCLQASRTKTKKQNDVDTLEFSGTIYAPVDTNVTVQYKVDNADLDLQGDTVFDSPVSASINIGWLSAKTT